MVYPVLGWIFGWVWKRTLTCSNWGRGEGIIAETDTDSNPDLNDEEELKNDYLSEDDVEYQIDSSLQDSKILLLRKMYLSVPNYIKVLINA